MRYPAKNKHSFSSLRTALKLLHLFSIDEPELTITDIANKLDIGISTAFRLANTLFEEGLLVKDPNTKTYRLAATILDKGNTIISKIEICQISKSIIEKLATLSGETAHIAIYKDHQLMYLFKIDSTHPVHLLSHTGKLNPLHCTSTGQVLLAYQNKEIIEEIIRNGLRAYTNNTIINHSQLMNVLHRVRDQGYAVSKEELHYKVNSVAAPVRGERREVIAAVSIAGPITRINDQTIPRLTKLVLQAANEVSIRLNKNINSRQY